MQLFLTVCKESKSPAMMESIILLCLKIIQGLIKPDQPVSKKNKTKPSSLWQLYSHQKTSVLVWVNGSTVIPNIRILNGFAVYRLRKRNHLQLNPLKRRRLACCI